MLNINVTNSYGNGTDTQAVAVTADGDYQVYKGCVIDSFQDTLYIKSTSSYFFRCLIAGSVDFIFGAGTAWFEKSKIAVKQSHSINIITAQRKTVLKTQFVFNDSRVVALGNVANQSTYLGRPWSENASVTYQFCKLSNIIKPEGWRFWNPNDQRTQNIKFFEFQNTGPGSLGERKYGRRAEAALNITEVLGSVSQASICTLNKKSS
ncbi:pectin lyase fold/virulence factor [Phakopsora pachyrhizi]|nr:pectin lyase fold/virulence factor [Phakopsora pachyrhizi]